MILPERALEEKLCFFLLCNDHVTWPAGAWWLDILAVTSVKALTADCAWSVL